MQRAASIQARRAGHSPPARRIKEVSISTFAADLIIRSARHLREGESGRRPVDRGPPGEELPSHSGRKPRGSACETRSRSASPSVSRRERSAEGEILDDDFESRS